MPMRTPNRIKLIGAARGRKEREFRFRVLHAGPVDDCEFRILSVLNEA